MPFRPQIPGGRGRFVFFPLVFVAAALALGGVVMVLWNAILPAAAHAGVLGYWQALGLLVLCRVLFGSWGGGRPGGGPGRRGWGGGPHARWQAMSEDERQQFRQRWQERGRRGWGPPPATGPGPTAEAPAGQ